MKIEKCKVRSCKHNNLGGCALGEDVAMEVVEIVLKNRYEQDYFLPIFKCKSFIANL